MLLLDEPTNHMDIVGKESLENILKEYKGTLIFVSHDRYFVNKIADSLLIFEKDGVTYFNGTYGEYRRKIREQEEIGESNANLGKNGTTNISNKKVYVAQEESASNKKENTYFINKEKNRIKNKINKLESEIEEKEEQIKLLQEEMLQEEISTDYLKLKGIQDKIQELNQNIESRMEEWEELSNKI
mgnify:FL=1